LVALSLYLVRRVLVPFIIAAFLSYVLEPVVLFFQRFGISRRASILSVYALLFLIIALMGLYFIPRFAKDLRDISLSLPLYLEKLQGIAENLTEMAQRHNLPPGLERGLVNAIRQVESTLERSGENVIPYFFLSLTFLSYLVLAPIIGYYILRDINKWRQKILVRLAGYPLAYLDLARDIDKVLAGFVRGQSIVALAVMILVWAASTLLGLKYAVFLGVIGGLGEFVPYFGPIAASVPMIAVALLKSPITGLWAFLAIVVIQWFDSNILVPRVTGSRVGLHPLWIIFSLLVAEEILGIWGVFVAVPVAGVAKALVKFLGAPAAGRTPSPEPK